MARELTVTELLGALIATKNLTLEDSVAIAEFAEHVNVQYREPAESLESAIDIALNFFNDDPDTESARVEAAKNECDHDHCVECGAPLEDFITELDFDMAVELWIMVRDMVRARDGAPSGFPLPPDVEEC